MKLHKIAGWLMVLSGMTHPGQLLLFGTGPDIAGPALFGTTGSWAALWVGVALPLLGGIGSVYRIVESTPNPFTHFHAALDFVVVGLCLSALARKRGAR